MDSDNLARPQVAGRPAKGYIPTLDGWRAIAILLVLLSHYGPFVPGAPASVANAAGPGVSVFFAISGLLICTLLLREQDLTGRIDLRSFYLRRGLRILPVAWLFLIVVALVRRVADLDCSNTDLWASFFFVRNYFGTLGGSTHHFWTLAIEEHFYLIFPFCLAAWGARGARRLCVGFAIAVMLWRWCNEVYAIWDPAWDFFRTDIRIDALFDGALAALLLHEPRLQAVVKRMGPWAVLAAALAGLGVSHFVPVSSINRSLVALLIPLMLVPGILYPRVIFARVLEWSGLRWIGRISYSLYIWQGLFTGNERRMLWGARLWPVNLCAMLGTAVASYYLLERPIIRWGHRMLRPVTHGRRDLE